MGQPYEKNSIVSNPASIVHRDPYAAYKRSTNSPACSLTGMVNPFISDHRGSCGGSGFPDVQKKPESVTANNK